MRKFVANISANVCQVFAFIFHKIMASKSQLRKRMASVIQAISAESVASQSREIAKKVITHPKYDRCRRLSIYLSTEKEIDTESILEDAFGREKIVYVPRFDSKKSSMSMVKLENMHDYRSLPTTTWNIRQPNLDERREDALITGALDLVLVPGVAFTTTGKRLGHGKGYYDTFFAQHFSEYGTHAYSMALSLREQILDDIPTTDRDHVIDEIVYDDSP